MALLLYGCGVLLIPNFVLAFTEVWPWHSSVAGILLMGGLYAALCAAARRPGAVLLLMMPLSALCAIQIVLLFLYGGSIIASDMFLNMMTTNAGEAGELLDNLCPALFTAFAIYLPPLIAAAVQLRLRRRLSQPMRRGVAAAGCASMVAGLLMLVPACRRCGREVMTDEIFPVNVVRNIGCAVVSNCRMRSYEATSAGFSYMVAPRKGPAERRICVYIIGEASRAASWQLYGYERPTNPRLSQRRDLCLFENVVTQSNATHKSVPMLLSPVPTSQHYNLYCMKGLAALFGEAGFRTFFLSNQSPQGAMVDKLAQQADEAVYIGAPRQDMQLLTMMQRIADADAERDLLFILHCYGSHFSYNRRYPREFARFLPDDEVAVLPDNAAVMRNAYDNSVLYTDFFLASVIEYLESLGGISSLLYCSDHGEDLFDDGRDRFLHASPTVTYYQLHVPSFAWFSPRCEEVWPEKCAAARAHRTSAATTHAMFHTMADMAGIESPFIDRRASLADEAYRPRRRNCYLDDHNHAVPLDRKIGIDADERRRFALHGIGLDLGPDH